MKKPPRRAVADLGGVAFRDALEGGVVERQDEVTIGREVFWPMLRMNGVHPLQRTYPRRCDDFEGSVGVQAPNRERVTLERLVIGRPEEMGERTNELDAGRQLISVLRHDA